MAELADAADFGNWTYTYTDSAHGDRLDRLMSSSCTSNSTALCPDSASAQAFTYTYDRFGNRWTQTVTAGAGPQPQYSFNAGTNRVDQFTYDAAGNMINDGMYQYAYDAENRLIAVNGATYLYDAEGRRVNKASGGGSLDYLFDPAGRQIAEVGAGGIWDRAEVFDGGRHLATYNGGAVYFHNADWLGTERVRTNLAGTIAESCQSLPFGDGQVCNGGDFSPMHFTGKPRDTESNLDDFPARYYSSTQGRWVSADWSARPEAVPYANLGDPQSLNLYAYVGDDPANHADPDGHIEGAAGEPDSPGCNSQNTSGCKSTKTKSDRAATITVTVEQVKASTLFGHVVVKVGTGSAVGLVPDSGKSAVKAVAKEAASAATIGVPLPSPVSGHVESLEPNRIVEATATLQVTIDQAQAMQATVTQAEAHPQQYDPAFHNCASFVEDVLRSGGINVPEDMTPGGLVTDLKHQNPQWL